jgi:nucleoprotein TPR
MATVQLDTRHLSTTYAVPESTIQTLLDAPTAELVRSFLERLAAFAKEHDIFKAEKLRSDVELETAVRAGENRARQMRDSVQNNLAQVETLRRQLGDSGWFHALLESILLS